MAAPPRPFYDPLTNAYRLICSVEIRDRPGVGEDVVWNAWCEILKCHFQTPIQSMAHASLAIFREAYRERDTPRSQPRRPDVVVILLSPVIAPFTPGLPPQPSRFIGRDYLWVECKASQDTAPSAWKTAINEATQRLAVSHPARAVGVLVALGIRVLFFVWDPANQTSILHNSPLYIRGHFGPTRWDLHRALKPAPGIRPWHDRTTNQILTTHATYLDVWNHTSVMNNLVWASLFAFQDLEWFFSWVASRPWLAWGGPNPSQWSV
jgi:hypothetical protein